LLKTRAFIRVAAPIHVDDMMSPIQQVPHDEFPNPSAATVTAMRSASAMDAS